MSVSYTWILLFLQLTGTINQAFIAATESCSSIGGYWYDELGSRMKLEPGRDGQLRGSYKSAVERTTGLTEAGSNHHSKIFGAIIYNKPGTTFGFSVMWQDGEKMSSWTGQCLVCDDGEEVLETSWILKSKVEGCRDKWKSTMIGQTKFRRNDTAEEEEVGSRPKREIFPPIRGHISPAVRRTEDETSGAPCSSLKGSWYNEVGSEMIINTHKNNSIRGEYRTAVERCHGAAGSSHSEVYGVSNSGDSSSTIALYVLWNNGESITGWTGQCHICGENNTETLIMTWLLRSRIESCHENWKATNYGEAIFTRHEQNNRGPRKALGKRTPREAGEKSNKTCAGRSINERGFLNIVLIFSALLLVALL